MSSEKRRNVIFPVISGGMSAKFFTNDFIGSDIDERSCRHACKNQSSQRWYIRKTRSNENSDWSRKRKKKRKSQSLKSIHFVLKLWGLPFTCLVVTYALVNRADRAIAVTPLWPAMDANKSQTVYESF